MGEKELYLRESKRQLNEWKVRLHDLERRVTEAPADVRQSYKEMKQDVHEKMAAARHKRERLENCGPEAWQEIKDGWEASKTVMTEAMKRALSLLG